jgi:hypothetical protein
MEFAVIGVAVFFVLVCAGLFFIDRDTAAQRDRIARATRPRHGARIIRETVRAFDRPGDN